MATGKKSFVLYTDYDTIFEQLTDTEAGRMIKHLFKYVNDKNPELDDRMLKILFEPIKQQLKRDLKKWDKVLKKKSDGGKKGMAARWGKDNIPKDPITNDNYLKDTLTPITDTVTVNDTVTDNVNERENTGPLANSNLFRKPNIPTKQQVLEATIDCGGTREMAKSFYEKHDGLGWFVNGSPVVNYKSLVSKFVSTWKDIERDKPKTDENFNPHGHLKKLG